LRALTGATHGSATILTVTALKAPADVHGVDMAFRFGSLMLIPAAMHFYFLVNIDRHHLGQHDEVVAH
jgi:hypothetical protein